MPKTTGNAVVAAAAAATMAASLVMLAIACRPTNAPQPFPPAPLPAQGYMPPEQSPTASSAPVAATPEPSAPVAVVAKPPAPATSKGQALGGSCDINTDCASGYCGGQGCGHEAGVCRAPISTKGKRAVAKSAPSTICGCDGKTQQVEAMYLVRYAYAGSCKTPTGAACAAAGDCVSGVCEGLGCGPGALGVCVSPDRGCTRDIKTYCGCDGVPFEASGTCPSRRYAARGGWPLGAPIAPQ